MGISARQAFFVCSHREVRTKMYQHDQYQNSPAPSSQHENRQGVVMATGTVKWFNSDKGFGFITQDDGGPDVFAHFSAIATSGFRSLEENQRVEFSVTQGQKGLQAENIRPL